MQTILDAINEWMLLLLVEGIMGNLEGIFDGINTEVARIATDIGKTPSQWNGGVFSMIESLSDNVILPIAGVILTLVMCQELISMIVERNNMHDFAPSSIFVWLFKTCVAVLLVSNTFDIIMGVFDLAQSVVQSASGIILTDTAIGAGMMDNLRDSLMAENLGTLLGLYLQSAIMWLIMWALGACVFVIAYGRMLEIYLMTSIGAIPIATMTSRQWNMGQNYLKSLLALGFQGFLIMVCVAIYAVLIQSIATGGDPMGAIWTCIMYTVLLCFALFKTSTVAKSVFTAH